MCFLCYYKARKMKIPVKIFITRQIPTEGVKVLKQKGHEVVINKYDLMAAENIVTILEKKNLANRIGL